MIKRIFILLFAAFSFFSCTEDETIEIDFPELVGTWELDSVKDLYRGIYYFPAQFQSETLSFTKHSKLTWVKEHNESSTSKVNYIYAIEDIKRDAKKITFKMKIVSNEQAPFDDRLPEDDGYMYWNIEGGCLHYSVHGCFASNKYIYKKKE